MAKMGIEEKGYKQKIIAEKAKITERQLSLILSGKRKCDVEEYVRICAALGVPVTTFIIENISFELLNATRTRKGDTDTWKSER